MQPSAAARAAAAAAAAAAAGAPPAVYCYSGPGAGSRSVLSTLHSLREALVPSVKVASLDAAELLAGGWQDGCLLLVMPGGADLPYCKVLNGRGNALIREYVEGGGAYLGLCAGAYYACSRVEFEPGNRLEVVGDRELALAPGVLAAGSIYKGFEYESENGAVAARLAFLCLDAAAGSAPLPQPQGGATAGGGPGSPGSSSSSSAAAGEWQQCIDYVNGGPGFVRLDGSALAPQLAQRLQQQAGGAGGGGAGGGGAEAACPQESQGPAPQQQQQAQQQQQQAQQQGLDSIQVLAAYPDRDCTAAALLCRVGARGGRAVLCGSHPELHASWLEGQRPQEAGGGSSSSYGSKASTSSCQPAFVDSVSNRAAAAAALAAQWSPAEHVQRLQAALAAGQPQRWRFWRSLLVAAGLQPWLRH